MKIAKYFLCLALLLVAISAEAQQLRKEAFDLLNLDYPGLEKVKAACAQQQWIKRLRLYWTITANAPA